MLLLGLLLCFASSNGLSRLQEKALLENPSIPNRLLNPSFKQSIAHILLNPFVENPEEEDPIGALARDLYKNSNGFQFVESSELVSVCSSNSSDDFPDLFPRFLCGLVYVYKDENTTALPFSRFLFDNSAAAIRSLNSKDYYPCHSMNMTDVVALVPKRIYSGCISDSDPGNFSQFDAAFVMDHPFPDVRKCVEGETKPRCELRSMIVQHQVLFQHEDCCCESDSCAILVYSQRDSLTPLILTTVELSKKKLIAPKPVLGVNSSSTSSSEEPTTSTASQTTAGLLSTNGTTQSTVSSTTQTLNGTTSS
ncbi:unnamed protein product [Caenorhabditis sp. 36 PRJEB53466]|nr:unnamed protein product [Caenorhabditis sp. 36 PRJEB53466]